MSLSKISQTSALSPIVIQKQHAKTSFCSTSICSWLVQKIKELWDAFCRFIGCRKKEIPPIKQERIEKVTTQPSIQGALLEKKENKISSSSPASIPFSSPNENLFIPQMTGENPQRKNEREKPQAQTTSFSDSKKESCITFQDSSLDFEFLFSESMVPNEAPSKIQKNTASTSLKTPAEKQSPAQPKEKPEEKKPLESTSSTSAALNSLPANQNTSCAFQGVHSCCSNPQPSNPLPSSASPSLKDLGSAQPKKDKVEDKASDAPFFVGMKHVASENRTGYLQMTLRGDAKDKMPEYVGKILEGNAHELLDETPHSIKEMRMWGRDELCHLAECPCPSLSRTKNPFIRRQFDESVVQYCLSQISRFPKFHIAHLASGCLFSSFVQAVLLVNELKKKGWKGKLHWNFIDIIYKNPVMNKLQDSSRESKSIQSFCALLAKNLPDGIEIECNFFPSIEEYQNEVSNRREMPWPHCLIGMDLANAESIWEKIGVVRAPYTFDALLGKTLGGHRDLGVAYLPEVTFHRRNYKFSYIPKEESCKKP